MKVIMILLCIVTTILIILATPLLMALGVVSGWAAVMEEFKSWKKLYWRSTDERN
jgi:uncharacterized membrane protein